VEDAEMSQIATLLAGNIEVAEFRNYVYPFEFMTIFRESDRRTFIEKHDAPEGSTDETGWCENVYQYAAPASVIRDRLNIMGFTLQDAKRTFEESMPGQEDEQASIAEIPIGTRQDTSTSGRLESYTFEEWLSAVRRIQREGIGYREAEALPVTAPNLLIREILGVRDDSAFFAADEDSNCGFPLADLRVLLRAILEVTGDEHEVILDYTSPVVGGYYSVDDEICTTALATLRHQYVLNERILVLTEGRFDSHVLGRTLRLLYPHLHEYYSFMDFGSSRLPGGCAELTKAAKAFIGASIANRLVALFDNDTAGCEASKDLRLVGIPENMRVMTLPDLALAKQYPTIGPQGDQTMDVNGLACSLELFFGETVLRDASRALTPVRWTGYNSKLGKYQGEISNKSALCRSYLKVLRNAERSAEASERVDWIPMRTLFRSLFAAFSPGAAV
jgi:hypothetical protein